MPLSPKNPDWEELINEHLNWLRDSGERRVANWRQLLKADREAALWEAVVRELLQHLHINVQPNEGLADKCGGPDFRCYAGEELFYVEATCVSIETADNKMKIKRQPTGLKTFNPWGMVDATFSKCRHKAPQCANLNAPVLVAVGTFHSTAAVLGFKKALLNFVLAGKTKMAWDVHVRSREQLGDVYLTTELESAAFLRPDDSEEIGFARGSISGLLLCAPRGASMGIKGVLHPNPARSFDPMLLPGIEFAQVELDRREKQVRVWWSSADGD